MTHILKINLLQQFGFLQRKEKSIKFKGLKTIAAPLSSAINKTVGLTHFLKGYYDGDKVFPLGAQESYRLSSFAKANCLIQIEENTTHCEIGEKVSIHLLPE